MANENRQLKRRVRTSYAISTVSIALVLFLLGTLGYLLLNALSATNRLKENIVVNVMLRDDLPEARRDSIAALLAAHQAVRKVEFVDKKQAAEEFKEYIGTDFESFLGANPLPDSFRVGLRSGAGRAGVEALEAEALAWSGVSEVLYQKGVVERITANINKFLIVLLLFGGTLMVICVVLLRNTIRAAIYARKQLITTMKLVGATRGFILGPFLAEAARQGIYAGLISSAMLVVMVLGIREGLPDMTLRIATRHLLLLVGGMIVGGMAISLTFTAFAVDKFIKMRTREIYYV